jgi:hypothetical protein
VNPDVLSQSLGCGHYSQELHFGLSHFRLSPLRETTWCSIKRNGLSRRSKISYWEGFVGLWHSPFGKLCEKMLAVSWGGAEGLEEL